jgi:hypothetical protein
VTNPPIQDGSLGHRVRPSSYEIEALITTHKGFPEEERQTHFQMQSVADDAEVNVVLNVLAGESSRSARADSVDAIIERVCDGEKRICSPGSARCKWTHRVSSPAMSIGTKRRKRKLRHSSGLELEADSTTPNLGDGATNVDLEDDVESCGGARVSRYVLEEGEEVDEEDMPSLVHRNHHGKASNDVPDQALSGLVSLQGMTMSAIDHALEEVILEHLLMELSEAGGADVGIEVLDGVPSASFLAGQETTPPVCHASLALEGALVCENTLAPKGATEDGLAPKDVSEDDPAPRVLLKMIQPLMVLRLVLP